MVKGSGGLLTTTSHCLAPSCCSISTVRGPVDASTTWGGGIKVELVESLSIWIRGDGLTSSVHGALLRVEQVGGGEVKIVFWAALLP